MHANLQKIYVKAVKLFCTWVA